jgi:hypothetical protein
MSVEAIDPEDVPLAREAQCLREEDIELSIRETLAGFYDPTNEEKWWQDQSDALLRRGYKLRRRFRKDWTPSWLGRDAHPDYCEDRLFRVVSESSLFRYVTVDMHAEHSHSRRNSNM